MLNLESHVLVAGDITFRKIIRLNGHWMSILVDETFKACVESGCPGFYETRPNEYGEAVYSIPQRQVTDVLYIDQLASIWSELKSSQSSDRRIIN